LSRRSSNRFVLLSFAFFAVTFSSAAQNPATTVTVDASANRHAISANIYGVAYGDATTLPDLNFTMNRYGGNNTSRYNWQINGDNRGQDWYFESIGDTSATAGERGDTFFSTSKAGGAGTMLTVPLIGWVAKLGTNRDKLASFSIAKYGAQTGSDAAYFPDAGNGILASTGQDVTGNDPNDADVSVDSTYQQGWVQHLVSTWGKASSGGVGYYILDNEHSIWFSTHRDVHPTGPTMDEIYSKIIDYSAKIKAVDPTALVVGPEEWGWDGYFYSGYDQQWGAAHGWSNLPDRANHGGQDYLPWLLSQLKQNAVSTGQRLLDVFSVHYYPQSGEFGNDVSNSMQLLRNQSTRSLWDPNYVDQSWINATVELIPRLKNWVSTYYFAGTPVAITEYNWGAEPYINGATTQADILGIFGREGLDLATRWTTPDPSTPTYKAMKMYRNYDGNKSGFGDTSVSAAVANPDDLSAFAAVRSADGALTVMVINKVLSGSTPVTLALNNFAGNGTSQVYQLTAANSIQHLSGINYSAASLGITVPAQSITLLILPRASVSAPSLSITKTHIGNFAQGQQSATYTVTVSNANGAGATNGTVTVTETLPSGLTMGSMSGTGWNCGSTTCTRSDALAAGASYPAVTVTVNVALNAPAQVTNQVSVSGGGSATASATDPTTVLALPAAPVLVSPANAATGVSVTAGLSWNAASGAASYDVYFGTASTPPLATNTTGTSYSPATLSIGTLYYWRIVAKNSAGSTSSATWSFTTQPKIATKVGVLRSSSFMTAQDVDGNIAWDPGTDRAFVFGTAGDVLIKGDWDGSGTTKIGIFRPSAAMFALDMNGNGVWDPGIDKFGFFGTVGDVPIVGDWTGDGKSKIGIFRPTTNLFALDINNDLAYEAGTDKIGHFGISGDLPIVGDWTGDGISKIGIYRPSASLFAEDVNNNLTWDAGIDKSGVFGASGDTAIVGDWTGDGISKIGIYRSSVSLWALDINNNLAWDSGTDKSGVFGAPGDLWVIGDWDGSGVARAGIFRPSVALWGLDWNGNLTWDAGVDKSGVFGAAGDTPVVGRWH